MSQINTTYSYTLIAAIPSSISAAFKFLYGETKFGYVMNMMLQICLKTVDLDINLNLSRYNVVL